MAASNLQANTFNEDRRPALHASMAVFLVINNLVVAARCFARYRATYKMRKCIYLEDVFLVLSGLLINTIIANLLVSTHYGLGLHAFRIKETDPHVARNMSNVFKHVWICMVLFSPTFASIKLTLLFFYRRMFLVHQQWLRIAWWANLIYIMLWVTGATGFYIFQCWPVQWYYIRFYEKAGLETPGDMHGQCNATNVKHVAMPVIFSLISDVGLLLLPIAAILKLRIDRRKKLAILGIFSVGILACLLGLARILELELDTDDTTDASYGVVIFLILSAAEAVCAIVCASLPVVGPQFRKEYKAKQETKKRSTMGASSELTTLSSSGKGFQRLGAASHDSETHSLRPEHTEDISKSTPLNIVTVETPNRVFQPDGNEIVVESDIYITR